VPCGVSISTTLQLILKGAATIGTVEYYSPPAPPPREPYVAPPLEPDRPSLRNRAGGAIAAIAVLLGKFKGVLLLLPKLKILSTSGTMLVSVAAYALIWGWTFAAGFVALLFIHEMGHVIQLRREGIKATAPVFIPFMGAFVGMKQLPDNAAAEARVGLAGPVLGSIGCLIPLGLYAATGDDFWKALAFTGFFLNLFNLLPVLPLDGGRAMAALSPWMWFVGFGLLIGATLLFPSPIMLLILLFGGMETLRRWRARKTPASEAYHRVTRGQRIAVALVYLGLALALAVGMDVTHLPRTFGDA
jgi:Zn-dependent protease